MKNFLKKMILGTIIPQEYLCLGLKGFSEPFSVFLTGSDSKANLDVSAKHIFLGYKPVIIAIVFNAGEENDFNTDEICLHFNEQAFHADSSWNHVASDSSSIARLSLKKIKNIKLENRTVVLYEGTDAWHKLISTFNQKVMSYVERKKNKPEHNIDLNRNLYEQVRVAYSVPRIISLISVYDGTLMNLFPTDLHGCIDENFYTSSLRIGGKACNQVEQNKRIVISEIDASQFRESYTLGKRHMKEMELPSNFKIQQEVSATFKFPLPLRAGLYRELEWIDHFDAGLHRIFIYKIIHQQTVSPANTLAHVHRYFAQWRMNMKIETNYLLR